MTSGSNRHFRERCRLGCREHGEEARRLLTIAPGQSGLAGVVNVADVVNFLSWMFDEMKMMVS